MRPGPGDPELGWISLYELATVRGGLGLPIERLCARCSAGRAHHCLTQPWASLDAPLHRARLRDDCVFRLHLGATLMGYPRRARLGSLLPTALAHFSIFTIEYFACASYRRQSIAAFL